MLLSFLRNDSKYVTLIIPTPAKINIALKIKEIALNYNVQIVENPPLARELYKKCNIGETIPENLYKAVAEVLAFVYKSANKTR